MPHVNEHLEGQIEHNKGTKTLPDVIGNRQRESFWRGGDAVHHWMRYILRALRRVCQPICLAKSHELFGGPRIAMYVHHPVFCSQREPAPAQ